MNQPAAELLLINRRFEQLCVADSLDPAHGTLALEAMHERLHRGVGNAFLLGQALEYLPHGAGSQLPELLQDTCLGSGQNTFKHCFDGTPAVARPTYRVVA